MPTTEDTKKLATTAHAGQVDKAGRPYVEHPAMVALKLAEHGKYAEVAGWLHDIVEDTTVTLADLRAAGYPDAVVDAVDSVSRRRGEAYMDLIARAAADPIGRLVKIADNASNSDENRLALLPVAEAERLRIKYAAARLVLLQAGGAEIVRSRDGQFAYEIQSGQIVVTHLPSGESTGFFGASLGDIRRRAASGELAKTITRSAYYRNHKQVGHLDIHLGREILVGDDWFKVARCNGYGAGLGQTRVFVEGREEPLDLPSTEYVRVRDPQPSPFTVVGVVHRPMAGDDVFTPLAVFAGSLAVGGRPRTFDDPRRAVVVEASTASKAEWIAFTAPAADDQVAELAPAASGPWTVVSRIDSPGYHCCLAPVAAIPGTPQVLRSPLAAESGRANITVVNAHSADGAMDEVLRIDRLNQIAIEEDY